MKYLIQTICLIFVLLEIINGLPIPINENKINAPAGYQIGVGIYDVTGPASDEGMMGYAMPQQRTAGLHMRLFARAFLFVDSLGTRFVYVSMDLCMGFQGVKIAVVQRLQSLYGNLYSHDNVMLSGTHTHSGPGGFSWYALYDITTLGFSQQNFDVVVNGIVQAIVNAHNNLPKLPGQILLNKDWLDNSNINRSPTSYLFNPASERAQYLWDTDKNITVLRLEDSNGNGIGSISWFAVHCTSMNNTNMLVSSDNKGYASQLMEKYINGNWSIPGKGPFVAAFGQSNEGDVSPNTKGPHCPDGTPCEAADSTCGGKTEGCIAAGPGRNMFESTQIIGNNQFQKTLELYQNTQNAIALQGPIKYIHTFINMSNLNVSADWTTNKKWGKTCQAAYGYSFAAGTTDGPGAFDFTQGDNKTSNPFWNFISSFIAPPTPAQIECQDPKPILLDVGLTKPIPWVPDVVPIQIATIGQLVLIAVPGEFTTMSGRRLRNTVKQVLIQNGFPNTPEIVPIIVGLANTYTAYIATYEEYQVQRYEAASTIFGPHTLAAYQQEFSKLAIALATNQTVPFGTPPRNLTGQQFNFSPPEIADIHPFGSPFGKVVKQVESKYQIGDTVTVVFQGATLRNNLMTGGTFLTVEKLNSTTNAWQVILTDANWETILRWERIDLAESHITVEWEIAPITPSGVYRIQHFGYAKENPLADNLTAFTGTSAQFTVA